MKIYRCNLPAGVERWWGDEKKDLPYEHIEEMGVNWVEVPDENWSFQVMSRERLTFYTDSPETYDYYKTVDDNDTFYYHYDNADPIQNSDGDSIYLTTFVEDEWMNQNNKRYRNNIAAKTLVSAKNKMCSRYIIDNSKFSHSININGTDLATPATSYNINVSIKNTDNIQFTYTTLANWLNSNGYNDFHKEYIASGTYGTENIIGIVSIDNQTLTITTESLTDHSILTTFTFTFTDSISAAKYVNFQTNPYLRSINTALDVSSLVKTSDLNPSIPTSNGNEYYFSFKENWPYSFTAEDNAIWTANTTANAPYHQSTKQTACAIEGSNSIQSGFQLTTGQWYTWADNVMWNNAGSSRQEWITDKLSNQDEYLQDYLNTTKYAVVYNQSAGDDNLIQWDYTGVNGANHKVITTSSSNYILLIPIAPRIYNYQIRYRYSTEDQLEVLRQNGVAGVTNVDKVLTMLETLEGVRAPIYQQVNLGIKLQDLISIVGEENVFNLPPLRHTTQGGGQGKSAVDITNYVANDMTKIIVIDANAKNELFKNISINGIGEINSMNFLTSGIENEPLLYAPQYYNFKIGIASNGVSAITTDMLNFLTIPDQLSLYWTFSTKQMISWNITDYLNENFYVSSQKETLIDTDDRMYPFNTDAFNAFKQTNMTSLETAYEQNKLSLLAGVAGSLLSGVSFGIGGGASSSSGMNGNSYDSTSSSLRFGKLTAGRENTSGPKPWGFMSGGYQQANGNIWPDETNSFGNSTGTYSNSGTNSNLNAGLNPIKTIGGLINAGIGYASKNMSIESREKNLKDSPASLQAAPFSAVLQDDIPLRICEFQLTDYSKKTVWLWHNWNGYIFDNVCNFDEIENRKHFNIVQIDPTFNTTAIVLDSQQGLSSAFLHYEEAETYLGMLATGFRVHHCELNNHLPFKPDDTLNIEKN